MKNILVVRNDKIGDFMLAWPSFALLKQSMPTSCITALVPSYTAPLAELCPWIDKVLIDCGSKAKASEQNQLQQQIKAANFDASLCLFSNMRNAMLAWRAHIPHRCAPATKLAQFLYSQRVVQRRSQSRKPEYQYNLDLVQAFLEEHGYPVVMPSPPYFSFEPECLNTVKQQEFNVDPAQAILMVHIGSGGSANNLSTEQYGAFIECFVSLQPQFHVVVTAGPGELVPAEELVAGLAKQGIDAQLYYSEQGLAHFCQVLAGADMFVAGSTGPLHIAGALDVPTVGFFPSRRSATPLRWQPLNSEGQHIAFSPPAGELTQEDMSLINVSDSAVKVSKWWTALGAQ